LENIRILLGVTGSIAAYRAAELARLLVKKGYLVDVVLTEGAERFITPLTFSSLVNGSVYGDSHEAGLPFAHLELAKKARIFLVCPATASTINKLAFGQADNLLTTAFLASSAVKIICPAMNVNLYRSDKVQQALKKLETQGAIIVGPAKGDLACGDAGEGRLESLETIIKVVEEEANSILDFSGRTFLITSGPTREWIDDVRFLSNASSGKMGTAIASVARSYGGRVIFITGPADFYFAKADELLRVESAEEMLSAARSRIEEADVLIMAAAVADFTVEKVAGKIKKSETKFLDLRLKPTPDILKSLLPFKGKRLFVGFSLEAVNIEESAIKKLKEKGLDLIVANRPSNFSSDFAEGTIIRADGKRLEVGPVAKRSFARILLREIAELLSLK
jgi:phosphopantothenoylcysteine decarboxylase/phosphopantothenate--cysteine ligase